MLSSRIPVEGKLSGEDAAKIAGRFLQEHGFEDMAETYRITQEGVVTINFAWKQGEVLCYSDLVKVSVARDTGAVCGFEAQGYIMSHSQRSLEPVEISREQAEEKLPAGVTLLSSQLVLTPSDGQYERLCYELKCADEQERHCLIYVGAQSGEQERILILLEDETGALTI
jgi:germination protein YpeB